MSKIKLLLIIMATDKVIYYQRAISIYNFNFTIYFLTEIAERESTCH